MDTNRERRWRGGVAAIAAIALAVPLSAAAPGSPAGVQTYLLSVPGGDVASVAAEVQARGGTVVESFDVASSLLVDLPAGAATPADAIVVPDMPMSFQAASATDPANLPTNTYRTTVGAKPATNGSGVTVALIDTGVADTGETDVTHVNVSGGPAGDGYGHGTFLSGLIAGNGASSNGAYTGVAPQSRILDVQVAQPDGSTSLSRVLAGLDAVADAAAADGSVKVVSLALAADSPLPPSVDPLTRGLERLWDDGLTVVVSAGNSGEGTVTSPASDPTLLAVGAVAENRTADRADDVLADFSAFGKVFGSMRPDLAAPGVSLVSLRSPGSVADVENPGARVLDKYFKGTGTSMSEAVAAGAVAGLLGARPGLKPDQVKRLFIGTAYEGAGLTRKLGAGAGGLDLGAALVTDVADTKPLPKGDDSTRFAPDPDDAEAWAAFSRAWSAGDLQAVVKAWIAMSEKTRRWAANAWSLAVLTRALAMGEQDFEGRRWAGRRWATSEWNGRRWATDEWVGRRWADIDWSGRRWADMDWSGRRWAADDWLAFAWTVRMTADDDGIAQLWANEEWEGRRWAGRRWAATDWTGRRWADFVWEGRRWADFVWDGRRWGSGEWTGRRWADLAWDGRRWATEDWAGRRWAVTGWGQ